MADLRHRKSGRLVGRTAFATAVLFMSQWFGWCGGELSATSPGFHGAQDTRSEIHIRRSMR